LSPSWEACSRLDSPDLVRVSACYASWCFIAVCTSYSYFPVPTQMTSVNIVTASFMKTNFNNILVRIYLLLILGSGLFLLGLPITVLYWLFIFPMPAMFPAHLIVCVITTMISIDELLMKQEDIRNARLDDLTVVTLKNGPYFSLVCYTV
jgi:hypothetical protein